jgi:hypothetical protein
VVSVSNSYYKLDLTVALELVVVAIGFKAEHLWRSLVVVRERQAEVRQEAAHVVVACDRYLALERSSLPGKSWPGSQCCITLILYTDTEGHTRQRRCGLAHANRSYDEQGVRLHCRQRRPCVARSSQQIASGLLTDQGSLSVACNR